MVALLLFIMATLEIKTHGCLFTFPSIILVFFNHFFGAGDLLLRNMLNRPARMKPVPVIPLTLKNWSLTW